MPDYDTIFMGVPLEREHIQKAPISIVSAGKKELKARQTIFEAKK